MGRMAAPPYDPFSSGAFAGPSTMFGGSPLSMRPDLNVGAMVGASPASSMGINVVMQQMLQGYLGPEYRSAGFSSTSNYYEQLQRKADIATQQAAAQAGARKDMDTYQRMIAGAMAATTGQKPNQAAVNKSAEQMAAISPFLAPFAPDIFDQMHGRRGSAQMLGMQVGAAGRYRIDPISGSIGYSKETAATLTTEIMDQLYGPNADITAMRGIGAGRAGILLDELSRRGHIGGASIQDRKAVLAELTAKHGRPINDFETNESVLGEIDAGVRKADAKRISKDLKGYVGAVDAVRELFGEAGRPDAPMAELVAALDALTQGGLGTMSGAEMEKVVRNAGLAATRAGSNVSDLMRLTSTVAPHVRALGLSPQTALDVSTEGLRQAAAFGQVFGGRNVGVNKDAAAIIDSTLSANARSSPLAMSLGALSAMAEDYKEFDIAGDTEAARLLRAAKAGETEYVDSKGNKKSVAIRSGSGEGSIGELLKNSGMTDAQISRYYKILSNPYATEAHRDSIADSVRKSMGKTDIESRIMQSFGGALAGERRDKAIDEGIASKIDLGAMASSVMTLSADDKEKLAKGDASPIANIIEQQLKSKGVEPTAEQKQQISRYAVASRSAAVATFATDPGAAGYSTTPGKRFAAALAIHDPTKLEASATQKKVNQVETDIQTSLADLGKSTPVQRLADALMSADEKTDPKALIASTLGFVKDSDVKERISSKLMEIRKELDDARSTSPQGVRDKVKGLIQQNTPASRVELEKIEKTYGMSASQITSLSDEDIRVKRMKAAQAAIERKIPEAKAELEKIEKDMVGGAEKKPGDKPAADGSETRPSPMPVSPEDKPGNKPEAKPLEVGSTPPAGKDKPTWPDKITLSGKINLTTGDATLYMTPGK